MELRTLIRRTTRPCLVLALTLASAVSLSGQEGRPRTPDRGAAPNQAAAPAVTDTVPSDTLSLRERAIQRLQAIPLDPVEVVELADTGAMGEATADSAGVAEPSGPEPGLEPDSAEVRPPGDAPPVGEEGAREEPAEEAVVEEGVGAEGVAEAEVGEEAGEEGVQKPTAGKPVSEAAPVSAAGEGPARPAAERPTGERDEETAGPGREPGVAVDDTLRGTSEPGPDRVMEEAAVRAQLRALEGYSTTEYTGQSAVFEVDGDRLVLTGESHVDREGNELATDSLLVYSGEAGVVCGYGKPVLSGQVEPVESDTVCFDIERQLGVAVGARTQFQQQATWYVRGGKNRVYLLTGGDRATIYGEGTEFTSCELDHPHYTFRAKSMKMVEGGAIVARDITLRFADVPVFWLPWMVQSTKQGRHSGVLMPQFGVNDIVRNSSGYNRHLSNLGFYWAINDYVSARGTFEWYSDNWTAVEGAITYRWLRQFLQGSVTAKQYWRQVDGEVGRKDFTINTSNSWQPDERTRIQLNANYATSSDFVRDYSFDPRELNRRITSSASINRSFSWGSVSLGADRSEQLSTGQVDLELPGMSLNISPVTLIDFGEGRGLSWSGSGSYNQRTRSGPVDSGIRRQETTTASYSHRFNLGSVGLSQQVNWSDNYLGSLPADTAAGTEETLEEEAQRLGWTTSLSYQQPLWPGTTVSPSLTIGGNEIKDGRTDGDFVPEPVRLSAGASLNTAIYGFWPGFGNYSRIRHKIAPSIRWSYSPKPNVSERQQEVFGTDPATLRERNQITLSFNQTFEAKVRESEPEPGDSSQGGPGAAAEADGAPGQSGEPRRLPQAEKVMLLALDTRTSFVYDFVAADEDGFGFQTKSISNSIRSDLLRGFQLTATHDLFEGDEGVVTDSTHRTFAPALTNLTASFSIDNNFWLFQALGLSGGGDGVADSGRGQEAQEEAEDTRFGAEANPDRMGGVGSVVPDREPGGTRAPRTGSRGWRATLNYTLQRPRSGQSGAESQLLSGNLSFEPTEKWSVRWSTAYSFTDGEFANHVLTLTRDLHRWTANFDFIKAQNGNFAMQFRVQLRDNPDLKVDYDQRSGPSERRSPGRGGFR